MVNMTHSTNVPIEMGRLELEGPTGSKNDSQRLVLTVGHDFFLMLYVWLI